MAYELYSAGLTTEQVGGLFEKIYGRHYSKQAISHMVSYAKSNIEAWLNRPLVGTYSIVYIEMLLKYSKRFYDRQFYTRTNLNKDILLPSPF